MALVFKKKVSSLHPPKKSLSYGVGVATPTSYLNSVRKKTPLIITPTSRKFTSDRDTGKKGSTEKATDGRLLMSKRSFRGLLSVLLVAAGHTCGGTGWVLT